MKLYHFNPNNWGETYYVMEKDKKSALESLIKHFEKVLEESNRKNKESGISKKFWLNRGEAELKIWRKVDVDDPKTYPKKYTIDEHAAGSVIEAECS